jgi:manganese transport protein
MLTRPEPEANNALKPEATAARTPEATNDREPGMTAAPGAEAAAILRPEAVAAGAAGVSLPEIHRSVVVSDAAGWLRRLLSFIGPGYLIAVGYMDPGNWATALAGGSAFGYTLLSVALVSSLMAMLLQALCARIGIATGRDLAQLCRDRFPRPVNYALWLLAEIAICATDLAELIGTAIALQLLFGIPLLAGVLLTALDALLILWLQHRGVRWLEALVAGLIVLVFGCFAIQLVWAQPDWAAVLEGYIPSASIITDQQQLYIAIGIVGATVMPHNLYLHTAVVQSRAFGPGAPAKREAIRFASIDSTVALVLALLVNSAILITAAAVFHAGGRTEVAEIQEAYELLTPMVGTAAAATLFAVALLACGLNATVTATLAGQVVMEGFLSIRLPPVIRRLVTRLIAIIPAVAVTWLYGTSGTAQLLILSQVVLCLQLPFAVVPLMLFAGDRARLGEYSAPRWQLTLGWAITVVIVTLNLKLLWDFVTG